VRDTPRFADLTKRDNAMTALVTSNPELARSPTGTSVLQFITRAWKAWIAWRLATATKVTLSSLDDRTLQDLGLRRIDIEDAITDMRLHLAASI
jgi:uncharacterized protein YjiS (DUF1127 family)